MCGIKINNPTTKANIETSKTIPAETSLAIFASCLCSFTSKLTTSSILQFIISAEITKTIKIPMPKNSYLVKPKSKAKIKTKIAAIRWIFMFWFSLTEWEIPVRANLNELLSRLKLNIFIQYT